MSFKNLEQRFNENVNTLYAGATSKFDGGKPSNNRTDEPLITRAPRKGYWGAMESRSTPIQSTAQDVKRLTLFQLSPRGLQFLAKQQLLQTGNTFEFTRALNPAFVIGNAVPFLHIKRNLRPLNELVGKTDTSYANVKSMGQLQNSTYNKLKSKTSNHLNFSKLTEFSRPGLGSALKNRLLAPLNALKDTVTGTLSAFSPNQKRNVGELLDKWGERSWKVSRPELISYIPSAVTTPTYLYHTGYVESFKETNDSQFDSIPFIKYFNSPDGLKASDPGSPQTGPKSSVVTRNPRSPKKLSYIKDPSNFVNRAVNTDRPDLPYQRINSNFTDPITVSFTMGKDSPVKFRAFIKDLVETSNPQYQPFQYIGRVEKFVNYTGVQREVSFKLAVIAFGPDELDTVWRRINYLTGLTFPYGFTRGIMQPNIVRLTVGGVYVDQPGYISGLSTNFNEPAGSWDIDKQVPIGASMDIKFTIIEKASRIAHSPFYGITDGEGKSSPMSGFSKTINVLSDPPTTDTGLSQIIDTRAIAERISADAADLVARPINNP